MRPLSANDDGLRACACVCACERLFVYRVKVISGASAAAGVNEEGRGR